jgi:hypothetical protein
MQISSYLPCASYVLTASESHDSSLSHLQVTLSPTSHHIMRTTSTTVLHTYQSIPLLLSTHLSTHTSTPCPQLVLQHPDISPRASRPFSSTSPFPLRLFSTRHSFHLRTWLVSCYYVEMKVISFQICISYLQTPVPTMRRRNFCCGDGISCEMKGGS